MATTADNPTLLPAATTVGPVTLRVADGERALKLYRDTLGLTVLDQKSDRIALGGESGAPFLFLEVSPGAPPRPRQGYAGLFHVAILVPDRPSLGGVLGRIAAAGIPLGASDHAVSEALYVYDDDGNGLEIYRDRPRDQWKWNNGRVHIITAPLDLKNLLAEGMAQDQVKNPVPAATKIGHVHLQVGDLAETERFYAGTLGFALTAAMPQALFMSAGGYHHHLGSNIWDSKDAPPAPAGMAGLVDFTIDLPTKADLAATKARLEAADIKTESEGDELRVRDPGNNAIRLRSAA
jgi:catechol 2,3-dioxygenase